MRYEFLTDTYRTEIQKVVSVWAMFDDDDLPRRPHPTDMRGRSLLEAESRWLAAPIDSFVVRLAGLYGPDRIIGLAAVRDGAPIVGDPQAMLNLIHADDAATLLIAVLEAAAPARIATAQLRKVNACSGSVILRSFSPDRIPP